MVEAMSVVCRLLNTRWPGFRRGQRDAHRLGIAHLADHENVGRLPHRGPKSGGKVRCVDADLDLLDEPALVRVLVLDGIFDGDDVPGVAAVDGIDQRGQRRGLARIRSRRRSTRGRASRRDSGSISGGRLSSAQSRHLRGQHADRRRGAPALVMQVDAEASQRRDPQRRVGNARGSWNCRAACGGSNGTIIASMSSTVEREVGDRRQQAVDANDRRRARHEQQIAALDAASLRPATPRCCSTPRAAAIWLRSH